MRPRVLLPCLVVVFLGAVPAAADPAVAAGSATAANPAAATVTAESMAAAGSLTSGSVVAAGSLTSGSVVAAGKAVEPKRETPALFDDDAGGNADADDPAIWVHPTKRSDSLVIGTAKDAGLFVYRLTGHRAWSPASCRRSRGWSSTWNGASSTPPRRTSACGGWRPHSPAVPS